MFSIPIRTYFKNSKVGLGSEKNFRGLMDAKIHNLPIPSYFKE